MEHHVVSSAWGLATLALAVCVPWSACSDGAGVASWGESTDGATWDGAAPMDGGPTRDADESLLVAPKREKPLQVRLPAGRSLNQIIEVAGHRIQYSAFRLPDGTINVGRVHGVT